MPMAQTILIFATALLAAAIATLLAREVRADLLRLSLWAWLSLAAMILSALSWFHANTRDSGTGTSQDHGWPKPFHFQWSSWEDSTTHAAFDLIYFLGNSLVYLAVLLLLRVSMVLVRPPEAP
jgi:hypothetical protein